jgi:O-antigen/teichoic acid export membrane protein
VGLWLVNYRLDIPPERLDAARWVLHFSTLCTMLYVARVPFGAAVMAHERFSFHAMMGLVEAASRLLLVWMLSVSGFDSLKLFAVLTALQMLLLSCLYTWYCYRSLGYRRYRFFREKPLYVELVNFSGWSMLGGAANMGRAQGVNILLNLFHGVTVNAAMGLANQIMAALNGFVYGTQATFSPQIMKSYAAGERKALFELVNDTTRYSYFLMLLFAVPLMINMAEVLDLWLVEVPRYAAAFCSLSVAYLVVDSLTYPLGSLIQATGRIRGFQIVYSAVVMLNLPVSWLLLRLGVEPQGTMALSVALNAAALGARMWYARRLSGFPLGPFFRRVLLVALMVTALALPVPLWLGPAADPWGLALRVAVGVACVGAAVLVAGLRDRDRDFILQLVKKRDGN